MRRMAVFDIAIAKLNGRPDLLVVDVASDRVLAQQYEGLDALARRHRENGSAVIGVPCNQFGEQEPGTPEQIAAFCSVRRVGFPLTEKANVDGADRHPLHAAPTPFTDQAGHTGDVRRNSEKFLVSSTGRPVGRVAPTVDPHGPELVSAIRSHLRRVR